MQCAKNNGFVTYFYTKNNLASYYREYGKNNHFIIPDLLKDSYEIVSISESGYRIESGKDNEEKTTLAKTADGILYLISNNMTDTNGEKFVMILNLNNKRTLYKKRQKENIYIKWFYPIANVVVPVLRITADGLFVDLVNLLNDRIDTISCNLECISQLIKELINEYDESNRYISDTVSLRNIYNFNLESISYEYQAYEGNNYYTKHIVIKFRLIADGQVYWYKMNDVSLDIKLVDKAISLYLVFDNSMVMIYNFNKPISSIAISEKKFSLQKYQFDNKIISIKLSNQLYVNECYMIYQDKDGFRISVKDIQLGGMGVNASVYSYKNYKIFVFALLSKYRRYEPLSLEKCTTDGIAIIDTKHNKILVWLYKSTLDWNCMQYSLIGSHYYSSDAQKLVFLSKSSDCFSVINTRGIDTAFDNIVKQQQPECQDKSNRYVHELMKIFRMENMITDGIQQEHKTNMVYYNIQIIGSYIDKNFDILYITATYDIDDTKYIGLFMWPIYDDNVRLRLIYYKDVNSKLLYHKPIKSLPTTIYRTITSNMLKRELNNRNTNWVDLHLGYDMDKHIFIDIKNNRSSSKILNIYNYFKSSTELISKFDNFLFVKYRNRNELSVIGELCFIVSNESMLVERLPVTYV
jgi:hypothetical protein